jgi:flagellar hook-associated protein 2
VTNLDTGNSEADKTVTITGTTLQDVVDGINAATGLNVTAAIVNLGGSTPKYALSLQSIKYGKFSLQLKQQNGTPLMTIPGSGDPALGSLVEYKVNGTSVTSDSRSVILAPNVTADIRAFDSTKDITITVGQSTTGAEMTLQAFASAYNAVLDQIDSYTGKGGVLAGNSLVSSLKRQMSFAVTSATGSGELTSLAEIGLEFSRTGRLTFNSSLFSTAVKDRFADLQSLIGTAETSGFMKAATDVLQSIDDAKGNGILESTITFLAASLRAEDARIEAEQKRVEQFTKDLQERLAKADAMIAALEQQAEYFTNMFEAMRANQKAMS